MKPLGRLAITLVCTYIGCGIHYALHGDAQTFVATCALATIFVPLGFINGLAAGRADR